MKKPLYVTIVTLILCLILVGCNFPKQKPQENQVDLLNTAAAQTVQAKQTLIAQPSEVPPTLPPSPTHTLDQSEPTLAPTSPPTAEPTAEPTAVPTITATSTPEIPCDQASFVSKRYLMAQIFPTGLHQNLDYQKHRFMHLDCRLSCCFLQW